MKNTISINKNIKKTVKIKGVHIIPVPLYRCRVEILFKQATEKVEGIWDNKINYGGMCRDYLENDCSVMITFPKNNPSVSTYVHELCHATQMILKSRGHNFGDIDEPFAYLLGYLVDEYQKIKR